MLSYIQSLQQFMSPVSPVFHHVVTVKIGLKNVLGESIHSVIFCLLLCSTVLILKHTFVVKLGQIFLYKQLFSSLFEFQTCHLFTSTSMGSHTNHNHHYLIRCLVRIKNKFNPVRKSSTVGIANPHLSYSKGQNNLGLPYSSMTLLF